MGLIIFAAQAGTVSIETAKNVARNFYSKSVFNNTGDASNFVLAFTQKADDSIALFYVFNVSPGPGFVIVSATDNVAPVLGYSAESPFVDQMPDIGLKTWVKAVSRHIHKNIVFNVSATSATVQKWSQLQQSTGGRNNRLALSPNGLRSGGTVGPLVATTWNQSPYYNMLCPYDNAHSGRSVTGCVATAMAQIMKYWAYPVQGLGTFTYIDSISHGFNNNIGTLSANFGATTYNWAQMPLNVTATDTAVALLMYQCGVSVGMDFGANGSYSSIYSGLTNPSALNSFKHYFSYDTVTIQCVGATAYTAGAWLNLIKNELNHRRPVLYSGVDTGVNGGHAWVCDGYDANDMLHMNWGWGGYANGHYLVTNLNAGTSDFILSQYALIGIQPKYRPVAAFGATVVSACLGTYQFIDSSSFADTWHWDFGDGTFLNTQNPMHTYRASGTYTVTLTVTNAVGRSIDTIRNYISVSLPAPTLIFDSAQCAKTAFTIKSNSNSVVTWYDTTGNLLATGNTYITPPLNVSTQYVLEQWAIDSNLTFNTYNIGPPDFSLSGGYYNFDHTNKKLSMKFSVSAPVILQSVAVWGVSAGPRTIICTDTLGNLLDSAVVNINAGGQLINLNFTLKPGGPYYLGFENDSMVSYTSTGTAFPYYDANNVLAITGTNYTDAYGPIDSGYYAYFYNWSITEPYCAISYANALANVKPLPAVPVITDSANILLSTNAYFYQWYYGNTALAGDTARLLQPAANGFFRVEVGDTNGCTNKSASYNYRASGISNVNNQTISIYPIPASQYFIIDALGGIGATYRMYNATGSTIIAGTLTGSPYKISTEGITPGVYFVTVVTPNQVAVSRKIVISK